MKVKDVLLILLLTAFSSIVLYILIVRAVYTDSMVKKYESGVLESKLRK